MAYERYKTMYNDLNDEIVLGNNTISPCEIEDLLCEVPGVSDAMVCIKKNSGSLLCKVIAQEGADCEKILIEGNRLLPKEPKAAIFFAAFLPQSSADKKKYRRSFYDSDWDQAL